ncbi:HRDC domain-containing protein [Alistipes timonensis]|uniref:HRDC domain-containing protein n=1 Tax=Alistipes timonensis TaxID=1465754 RepID=UPI001C3CB7D6|nr:HRDC domain-containing protein [Alistipes timonensis]MCR2031397.1 HRDC domain-containing protein [Alistipes timonensis]
MKIKTFEIRVDPAVRERDERIVNEFLAAVRVSRLHCGCLRGRSSWTVIVIFHDPTDEEIAAAPALVGDFLPPATDLTGQECERYEALCLWRDRRAEAMGRKPFVIASNRDLLNIARNDVATPEDLLEIRGFGPRRAERYGAEIVAVLDSLENACG